MQSLYNVIKKSAPYCTQHQCNQALYYNVQQLQFLCDKCVEKYEQQMRIDKHNNNKSKKTFTLQQIVQNPVLLMLKQGSFLSPTNTKTTTLYKVQQFTRILTDMDMFIKTKKSTYEFTQQFFTHLKEQINTKIDSVLQTVQKNMQIVQQLQKSTRQLKHIKKNYHNQFLQTLQSNFTNGTQQQLKDILKKYSLQNENPFRKIDEIVQGVSVRMEGFVEINWQHVMGVERRVLDGYMWRDDKVFVMKGEKYYKQRQGMRLMGLRQQSVILPYSAPVKLGFVNNNLNIINQVQHHSQQQQNNPSHNHNIFLTCTNTSIQLSTHKHVNNKHQQQKQQHQQQQSFIHHHQDDMIDEFVQIERFRCSSSRRDDNIDMVYQLPMKMLLSVAYEGVKIYSYQFNKIKQLSIINTIKGCTQVLVYQHYCLLLTNNNKLYQIHYYQLNKPVEIAIDSNSNTNESGTRDNTVIQTMTYLYQNGIKLQQQVLLYTKDKQTQQKKQIKLNI